MKTSGLRIATVAVAVAVLAMGAFTGAFAEEQKLKWNGTIYTKWLWGNQRDDGSLYNFTTIPGEGGGDNGQGSEFELFLSARVSSKVSISGRLKARFNQNFWTNYGGFGDQSNGGPCISGDCGEFDSRSAQYMKFRGAAVTLTPGYGWLDTAVIGSNDFGMFDAFTIGKIRYIDRDNASGLLFQGGTKGRKVTWDFTRISLPRLWAGPNFNTGDYNVQDAAYGGQVSVMPNRYFDIAGVYEYVSDLEVKATDINRDDGRELDFRFKNQVWGVRFDVHPHDIIDISGRYYDSTAESFSDLPISNGAPSSFFGLSGFSPVPAGRLEDQAWRFNVDLNDPFDVGLSFNLEAWDFGENYVSMMAARRESDVLLTEGFDGTWANPGPSNARFGVFPGNPTLIGYGGWQGASQQVITINVDNEFTDFDEPLAMTVTGWKGFTIVPTWSRGDLDLAAEYTMIDYNQNWQAFGDTNEDITSTIYPVAELDTGVGHNFRSAYQPFQDKDTKIYLIKAKYLIDVGTGLEIFGKVKFIDETDKRLNDRKFLPYQKGDCLKSPPFGCSGNVNFYNSSKGFSTASIYGNPPVIDVNGDTIPDGYQWKPFDDISDDDRDMNYKLYQLGLGYQLTDQIYGTLTYEKYDVDLKDGNTAFQAYNLHEMASGQHDKNKLMVLLRYSLTGTEFGLNYEYNWGSFDPDFGDGFVPTVADVSRAQSNNVPVGSRGFAGRFGGWNSLETRDFRQNRLKAYLKVQF